MSIEELKAENARLKTEVEHLMVFCNCTLIPNKELEAENARLKAEVERLKAEPDALTAYLYADTLRRDDIKTLKAQIERLTKAGDVMAIMLQHDEVSKDWNAAKEGKDQP
jgi:predicted RNase H-like nuclease (RuvC/YqgF family)